MSAQDRGYRQHRHGEDHGEGQQAGRREARHCAVGREPRLDEHPVLERGAERAAARRDLRERIAGELRADDRRPRRPAHRKVLEQPQARERERLQPGHHGEPPRGQLVEVVP
jgi:hypothetical protein